MPSGKLATMAGWSDSTGNAATTADTDKAANSPTANNHALSPNTVFAFGLLGVSLDVFDNLASDVALGKQLWRLNAGRRIYL